MAIFNFVLSVVGLVAAAYVAKALLEAYKGKPQKVSKQIYVLVIVISLGFFLFALIYKTFILPERMESLLGY